METLWLHWVGPVGFGLAVAVVGLVARTMKIRARSYVTKAAGKL